MTYIENPRAIAALVSDACPKAPRWLARHASHVYAMLYVVTGGCRERLTIGARNVALAYGNLERKIGCPRQKAFAEEVAALRPEVVIDALVLLKAARLVAVAQADGKYGPLLQIRLMPPPAEALVPIEKQMAELRTVLDAHWIKRSKAA